MKKALTLTITLVICMFTLTYGGKVKEEKARLVAQNWYRHFAPNAKILAKIAKTKEYKWGDRTSFYIFSFDKGGFVLVSANDAVNPILGYGFEGGVSDDITNEAVKSWFDGYARQIDTAFVLNLDAKSSASKWNDILDNKFPKTSGNSVGPLLTTTWHQVYPYNILSPQNPAGSGNYMPGGCTPIAVAQIMKYWNYPAIGIGYNEYAWSDQSISAYFNEKPYNIAAMPNFLTQPDSAVALLLFHAGVASSVDYQPDGSGAYLSKARNGLVDNFDYKTSAEYIMKWALGISDSLWIQMLKSSLDSLKPLIYEGYNPNIGHALVCDGYDENDFFHMNWGWGGAYNGFFLLNELNNVGGFPHFNSFQGAVFNIEPAFSALKANFTAKNGAADYQKQFADFSKGNPDSRFWDFGDGENSNEINPLHQFDTAGVYLVRLIVNRNGISDTIQKSVTVTFPYFTDINLIVASNIEDFGDFDLGDFDDDGDIDILMQYIGYINGVRHYYTRIFRNDGSMGFTRLNAGLPDLNYGSSRWCDFDNDNSLDCAILGIDVELNKIGLLFRKNGNLYEDKQPIINFPLYGTPAIWGDIDSDGDMDLVLQENQGSGISPNGNQMFLRTVYRNIQTRLVLDTSSYQGNWAYNLNIGDLNFNGINEVLPLSKVGDFDNDGDLDGFLRSYYYFQNQELIVQEPSRIFINQNGISNQVSILFPNAVDWGDFDGDGDYDILSVNTVYLNNNGSFVDLELDLNNALTWFDYDNDGDLDILFINPGAAYSNWKLLRNNANPAIVNPLMPISNTATPIENQVTINWERPLPFSGNGAGYTYNLFIGKSDSTCEVLSPMANIETGYRKIMSNGNASSNTSWTINRIPNGTYHYGIQSIDAQYRGSEFITGTFTINGENLPAELLPVSKQGYVHIPLTYNKKDFSDSFIDPEEDSLYLIKIISLPQYGNLFLNEIQVSIDLIIDSASIQYLTYLTDTIANDQFLWTASNNDGSIYTDNPASVNIIVYPLLEQPEYSFLSMAASLGDYDNDLDLDLLTGNVLINNNGGNFNDTVFTAPLSFRSSNFIDYDSDGLLDLLVANDNDGLHFYRNLGNASFEEEFVNVLPMESPRYAIGDYNCDGYIDVILSGLISNVGGAISEDYTTILYTNDKNGNFITSGIDFPPVRAGMFCFGDINNDGYPDLVMAGETDSDGTRILKIYFNEGNGGFIESNQELTGLSYGSLELKDVDRDGDLDLLACGRYKYTYTETYSSQTVLYINTNGNFQPLPGLQLSNINSGQARFLDVNQDGKLDILLNGEEYNYGQGRRYVSKLYLNRFPDFIEVENNIPKLYASSFAFGDIDNDGDEDVILSGLNPETFVFQTNIFKNTYGNNTYSENDNPTTPVNLRNNSELSQVVLEWDKSTDNTTPASAISYNLIVSKVSESVQLCAPMISPVDSIRIISAGGNVGCDSQYRLIKKPFGSYQWSVQAIDNSFAASPFAIADTIYFDGSPDVYDSILYIGPAPTMLSQTLFENLFVDYEHDTLNAIKIIRIPEECTLQYLGMDVFNGQIIRVDSINFLELIPSVGFYGIDSLIWNGSDGNLFSYNDATLAISVQLFKDTDFLPYQEDDLYSWWGNGAVSFGDYDNDNDLDLGMNIVHQTAGWLENRIYSNNGGCFELKGNCVGGGRTLIHWGDIDSDFDLDYTTSGQIVENTGNSFVVKQQLENYGNNSYWGDYNGDNQLDYSGRYGLFRNDSSGNFISQNCISWNTYYFNQLKWSDLNNDGTQDLSMTKNDWGPNNDYSSCLLNGDPVECDFTFKSLNPVPRTVDGSMDFADFDGDNDNDLLISGSLPSGIPYTRIFENQNGNFTEYPTTLPQLALGNAKWADLNLDGLLDIAMCGVDSLNTPRTVVLLNSANGFIEIYSGLSSLGNGWLDIGDMDNDGDLDLAISGIDSLGRYMTKLYRNLLGSNQYSTNTVPSAPRNLQTSVNNNSINFQWDKGADNSTPQGSLSYNMYVRRDADSLFIVSPMADLITGYRKVVELGNTSLNNHWRLDSLPAGTYYWSVQAIDNTFAGGHFAPEATFTIDDITDVDLNFTFGQGYTWFSQNLALENPHPNAFFEGLVACNNDRLISQSAFSIYQNGSWNGTIVALNPANSYRLKIYEAKAYTATAPPAEIVPITLNSGYTWMGYVPQTCLPVNVALANMNPVPTANDRLIGQGSFALYNGSQWMGSLTTLCPGVGYVIKLTNSANLVYPEASAKAKILNSLEAELRSPTHIKPVENLQHCMTVLGQLELPGGQYSNNADDRIYAFANGQCVGMANPMEAENGLIFLSVGENSDDAQRISFKIWLDTEKQLYEANEALTFVPLKGTGAYENPFKFTLGHPVISENDWFIGEPYPNPFNDETLVPVYLNEPSTLVLKLYNTMGQIVYTTEKSFNTAGKHEFILKKEQLNNGVYSLSIQILNQKQFLNKSKMLIVN